MIKVSELLRCDIASDGSRQYKKKLCLKTKVTKRTVTRRHVSQVLTDTPSARMRNFKTRATPNVHT
jgi:hypothetical protein